MPNIWTVEQNKLLDEALLNVPEHLDPKERWRLIAKMVPGKTSKECMKRYSEQNTIKPLSQKEEKINPIKQKIDTDKKVKIRSEIHQLTDITSNTKNIARETNNDGIKINDIEKGIVTSKVDSEKIDKTSDEKDEHRYINNSRDNVDKNIINDENDQLSDDGENSSGGDNDSDDSNSGVDKSENKADDDEEIDWEKAGLEYSEYAQQLSRGKLPPGDSRSFRITHLSMTIGVLDILCDTVLKIVDGVHYGFVGRNGVGKTTLLRRMAYHMIRGYPKYLHTMYIKQEVDGNELTALETVINSDVERQDLLNKEKEYLEKLESGDLSVNSKLTEVYDRLSEIKSESAESRARNVLNGLNFSNEKQKMKTRNLSGGWRMRVALACALFLEPDLMLLDEPTNHLDIEAVIWLQNYLQNYKKTVVVVSHDRSFLNNVADEIILMKNKTLRYYPGNYDDFLRTTEENQKKMETIQEVLDKKRERIHKAINNIRKQNSKNDGKGTGLIKSRKRKLERVGYEKDANGHRFRCQYNPTAYRLGSDNSNSGGWVNGKMTSASVIEGEEPVKKFKFPNCNSLSSAVTPIVSLEKVNFKYPNTSNNIFQNLTFSIDKTSRITLLGSNGIGKTTLLKLITGELIPQSGTIQSHNLLKIGYFTQHHLDYLDLNISSLDHIKKLDTSLSDLDVRSYLGGFGINGDLAVRPMGTLSGGQKSRVVFSTVFLNKPNILLLDEPTNHLDIDTIESFVQALKTYEGAVVMVTHDQYMVTELLCDLYVLENNKANKFEGNWDEYCDLFTES